MRATRAISPHLVVLVLAVAGAACGGDDDDGDLTGGDGGAGGGAGGGATAAVGASTGSSATGATTSASTGGGAGGAGGEGGAGQGGLDDFVPTPESTRFSAIAPLPDGEQILFNDWSASPNTVASMRPDGSAEVVVFEAYRVWGMGVSRDASTIAFSSGDPEQEAHYGVTFGDAIQHTFLYDAASETATNLTRGRINDECHTFSDDGASLYLCRRGEVTQDGGELSTTLYHPVRVDLATGAEQEVLAPQDDVMALQLQPDADEASGLLTWIVLPPSPPAEHSVRRIDLATGEVELVRADAGVPVLSPDGARYLYADYTQEGTLWSSSLEGGDEVQVVAASVTGAVWSPDGTRVAFLLDDDELPCADVAVASADGSDAEAPVVVRDCAETGEFVTELAWIDR
jgi:hypothetical protein